ncbi:MAG TPA: hypothetical protein VKF62_11270 [Planctomycetota bacterium]|nr:hypothetical protein [Planctomycetota bacterium]
MRHERSFWLRRPTSAAALRALAACAVGAVALAFFAARESPLTARAILPFDEVDLPSLYLTSLPEEPGRVLFTPNRAKSTLQRDRMRQAGSAYYVRRYGDPERPGLPKRILLTSRGRGAHLLVPVGALDLARALAGPVPEPRDGGPEPLPVGSQLVTVFEDRLFAGVFLELRFPPRPVDEKGGRREYDLVVVRENRVRTTDFLLQPNPRNYRAALAKGRMPEGPFRVRDGAPRELVFAFPRDLAHPCEPLWLPVSLFEELGLAWGEEVPTIVDDRWDLAAYPIFPESPATPELRARLGKVGGMQLAARLEGATERERLERSLRAFLGS